MIRRAFIRSDRNGSTRETFFWDHWGEYRNSLGEDVVGALVLEFDEDAETLGDTDIKLGTYYLLSSNKGRPNDAVLEDLYSSQGYETQWEAIGDGRE